jgi:CheY-like chemotaxis protein
MLFGRPQAIRSLDGLRVLAVDDNATNRRILEQMLRSWNMKPTVAESGEAALLAVSTAADAGAPYSLMLIDARMPGMDGFAVVEHITRDPRIQGLAIMMLSSADQRGDVARCRELGISVYVTKPVKQSQLLDAIVNSLGVATSSEEAKPSHRTKAPDVPTRRYRIQVAEDNAVNQVLAAALLEKRGHRVTVVDNGRLAVEAVARESFDLVLMDVQMPALSGIEATQLIRERERLGARRTPIIAMTARAMNGDRERCLEAGMDDYVSKPIRTADLFAAIEAVMPQGDDAHERAQEDAPGTPTTLDQAELLRMLGDDGALLRQLYLLFTTEGPRRIVEAREALSANDAKSLQNAAHVLAGSAGNLRAGRTRGGEAPGAARSRRRSHQRPGSARHPRARSGHGAGRDGRDDIATSLTGPVTRRSVRRELEVAQVVRGELRFEAAGIAHERHGHDARVVHERHPLPH